MITCENRVGRLIEARFVLPVGVAEIAAFARTRSHLSATLGEMRVSVIDLSLAGTMLPDQIDALVDALQPRGKPALRSAMLLPVDRATFALQMSRLNRETKHPTRRNFTDRLELELWLKESLDDRERVRLSAFLDGR